MLLNSVYNIGTIPASGHRYWRVYSYANSNGIGVATSIAKLELRNSGGTNIATGGTPSASGVDGGAAANAFDGNASTYWSHNTIGPAWLAYDFGSNVEIVSFAITARNDTSHSQSPAVGELQYSDDGSTWTRAYQFASRTAYTTGSQQVFTNNFNATPGARRYWELRGYGCYRTGGSGSFAYSCVESELRSTPSGSDATGSGTASAVSEFSGTFAASKAFDNNTTTLWASNSVSNIQGWLRYDFGSAIAVEEFTWRVRSDGGFHDQFPVGLCLFFSDDGSTWTPTYAWKSSAPSSGGTQTFTHGTP